MTAFTDMFFESVPRSYKFIRCRAYHVASLYNAKFTTLSWRLQLINMDEHPCAIRNDLNTTIMLQTTAWDTRRFLAQRRQRHEQDSTSEHERDFRDRPGIWNFQSRAGQITELCTDA